MIIQRLFLFLIAFLIGLTIEATMVHAVFPSAIAPDIVIILVVYLGLRYKSPGGALGAFLLGLGSDFASARFVGPAAAGSVLAFCLTLQISNRIYAEKGPAVVLVTFMASAVKSVASMLMIVFYTNVPFPGSFFLRGMLIEALFTAAIAPFVLRLFTRGKSEALAKPLISGDSYRRA